MIENISGANRDFEIIFSTTDKEVYKFIFTHVWDIRCSIENASLNRFYQFRKNMPDETIESCVFVVEDSDYIKHFGSEAFGTLPAEDLTHYIIWDHTDTIIDILVCGDLGLNSPSLTHCSDTEEVIAHIVRHRYSCLPSDTAEAETTQ